MKLKVEVYKCYLVEVVGDNGVLYSEPHFTNYQDAKRIGQQEKERLVRMAQSGEEVKTLVEVSKPFSEALQTNLQKGLELYKEQEGNHEAP